MIPVYQSIVGDGRDGRPYGDCIRACVASIFELPLEDVPHFAAEGVNWYLAIQEWLRPMGLVMEHEEYREPRDSPKRWPCGWWMASVDSENFAGCTHAVVMRGYYLECGGDDWCKVAHDPSPHPRRTPYVFRGARWFSALDPAVFARRAK